MFDKPRRQLAPRYLEFLKGKKCCVCFSPDIDAHHLITQGAGGSDLTCIPVCRKHHAELHAYGLTKFENKNRIRLWKENALCLAEFLTERLDEL